MTYVLTASVVVLALLVGCLFAALVEMFRQLEQLRENVGIADTARAIEFLRSYPLADLGISVPEDGAQIDRAAIVFLSDSCTTCASVAKSIPRKHTPRLRVVLHSYDEHAAQGWLSSLGLDALNTVQFDPTRSAALALGVTVVPCVVKFEDGHAVSAHTMPSGRLVKPLVNWIHGLDDPMVDEMIGAGTDGEQ